MDSFTTHYVEGRLNGFTLYGMKYRFTDEQVKWKPADSCHEILAGEVQKRSLAALLNSDVLVRTDVEKLAVDCMIAYFDGISVDFEIVGTKFNVVSTKAGSVAIVSNYGGMYNLLLRKVSDAFVFNRLLQHWPENYGMADVGSRTFAAYERLGYALTEVVGDVAGVERFNYRDNNLVREVKDFAKELQLTVWEIEYDTALVHSGT